MPIKIPADLPGRKVLEQENIALILEDRAIRQDIRPLRVAILNLMPDKIGTETQLLRALGVSPLQIEITLLRMASHESKNTPREHLDLFYKTHADVAAEKFDALIITGAPVEHLPYESVGYWPELQNVLSWATTHVYSTMMICWAALAGVYYYHGINKSDLPRKVSGIYRHRIVDRRAPLMAGFDDFFDVPVSRNTEIRAADVERHPALEILAVSDQSGIFILQEKDARRVYILNHLEYDAETIRNEYVRDRESGLSPDIPYNYFPDDDPAAPPRITWRAHRTLLFTNWLNSVYQGTPYDLAAL